jgi:hypothetical protein
MKKEKQKVETYKEQSALFEKKERTTTTTTLLVEWNGME